MNYYDFIEECAARRVAPAVALENEEIKQALRDDDDKKVIELLESESKRIAKTF